jgi:GNAT superfamily N-acetyltransferase
MERCFADTLDPDGQRYLQQMRSAANNPNYLRWAGMATEGGPLPVSGYVWEEDGGIVGNLTLIPYYNLSRRYFLVANVAVHPDYRRRGIASSLTMKAVEHARQRGAQAVWLHVRDENDGAIRLYRSLAFEERARRSTWLWEASQAGEVTSASEAQAPAGISVVARRSGDWRNQRAWLSELYPADLSWHLSLKMNALRPDLWGFFTRFLNDLQISQWSAWQKGRLVGVLAWQTMMAYANSLWLATTPEYEESAAAALLQHIRQNPPNRRPLSLDFPAGRASQAIQSAGFHLHQTLIWMSLDL